MRGDGNPGRWELTNRCHQIAFVNITYYEKATLCLRASIAQGKKEDSCGCKNCDVENVYYTEKGANVYHKLEKKGKARWLLLAL